MPNIASATSLNHSPASAAPLRRAPDASRSRQTAAATHHDASDWGELASRAEKHWPRRVPCVEARAWVSGLLFAAEPLPIEASANLLERWTRDAGEAACARAVGRMLKAGHWRCRMTTVAALESLGARGRMPSEAFALLQPLLADPFAPLRARALAALGYAVDVGEASQLQALRAAATDVGADAWVRRAGVLALRRAQDLPGLTMLLEDKSSWVRREAIDALAVCADFVSLHALKKLRHDPCAWVRLKLVDVLATEDWLTYGAARDLFEMALKDKSACVRHAASRRVAQAWGLETVSLLKGEQDEASPMASSNMLTVSEFMKRHVSSDAVQDNIWRKFEVYRVSTMATLRYADDVHGLVRAATRARWCMSFARFIGPLTDVIAVDHALRAPIASVDPRAREIAEGARMLLGQKGMYNCNVEAARELLLEALQKRRVPQGDRLALTHLLAESEPWGPRRVAALCGKDPSLVPALAACFEEQLALTPENGAARHLVGLWQSFEPTSRAHMMVRLLEAGDDAIWPRLGAMVKSAPAASWERTLTADVARTAPEAFLSNMRLEDATHFGLLVGMSRQHATLPAMLVQRLQVDANPAPMAKKILSSHRLGPIAQIRCAVAVGLRGRLDAASRELLEALRCDDDPRVVKCAQPMP